MYNETQTLLGYKLVTYDNDDVVLYLGEKVIGYGKQKEDHLEIFSEHSEYYMGSEKFEDFPDVVRFFERMSYEKKNESEEENEFLYWN